jgi:two-component system response regulator PhoP
MRVLIVEDEDTLRDQLITHLKNEGYAVDDAATGEAGLFRATEYPFDAAIIDLGLPNISGTEIIKKVRAAGITYPILILTARSRWQDKVEGLEAGADDYLVKPFHMEELQARIRALIRRSSGVAHPIIQYGPITIDSSSKELSLHNDKIELTAYEYKVIEYLIFNAGKVISKTELTEHIYDQDFDRDSNVIEVFIRRLRKKLDPDNQFKMIETLRGKGYRFTLSPKKQQ